VLASENQRQCFGRVLAKRVRQERQRNLSRPGVYVSITLVAIGMFVHFATPNETSPYYLTVADYLAIAGYACTVLHNVRVEADPAERQFLVEFTE
jgi:L-asparagine transporter-like permease